MANKGCVRKRALRIQCKAAAEYQLLGDEGGGLNAKR